MNKAFLFKKIDFDNVQCGLCAHRCSISPGKRGICNQRYNIDGELFTDAFGNVVAAAVDPIEKKPLYHFMPGTTTYSIAVPGCNFKCAFCQNWEISQHHEEMISPRYCTPRKPHDVVDAAIENGCDSIAFTYTEPVIFFEYVFEISKIAHEKKLKTVLISNGYMTDEALDMITPYLDACNIDLKAFTDEFYQHYCKARLQPVLNTIRNIALKNIHLEVTTLLIEGKNDSHQEINEMAEFLYAINPVIPWHLSRFFPRYKFSERQPTPVQSIRNAVNTAYENGLHYVYPGNIAEHVVTCCHSCGTALISRMGFAVETNQVDNGVCCKCGAAIVGVWS